MNERIKELFLQAGFHPPVVKRMGDEYKFEKFAELLIKETRLKAIEEVRQAVKWADWPITSLSIVEKACEKLSLEEPDNRYTGYLKNNERIQELWEECKIRS